MKSKSNTPFNELEKLIKDYRSKVADVTQQYWEIIGTGEDTGVTTELLNKIDEEAKAAIHQYIKSELEKIIGEDETVDEFSGILDNHSLAARNELRAEQRTKLKNYKDDTMHWGEVPHGRIKP